MEDDADGVAHSGADTADAMPEIDPVVALHAVHGPIMDGERLGVALAQRDDLGSALHPGPLFGQHELTAREVLFRFGKEDRHLERKREVAVKILMQAIEVARNVLEEYRRRAGLAGVMALLEECGMPIGILNLDSHATVPFVCDAGKTRIERRAETTQDIRKRVLEVFVLPLSESVARHMDVAAELTFLGVERRDLPTLVRRQELSNDGAAVATQFAAEILPVISRDARLRGLHHGGRGCACQAGLHAVASLSIRDRFSSTLQR